MNVVCPSCETVFEADDALAGGPGLPLCDDCSTAVRRPRAHRRSAARVDASHPEGRPGAPFDPVPPIPPAEPPLEAAAPEPSIEPVGPQPAAPPPPVPSAPVTGGGRRRRPKAPDLSFGPRNAEPSSPEISSRAPILPEAPAPPPPAPIRDERLSLGELAAISSGGPGLLDGGFDDAEVVSLRDLDVMLAPVATPPPWSAAKSAEPPRKTKPRFFQVDSIPPPPRSVDVLLDFDEPPRNSGHEDLRILTAKVVERPARRADAELLTLHSGLFPEAPPRPPLLPGDLALLVRGAPEEAGPPDTATAPGPADEGSRASPPPPGPAAKPEPAPGPHDAGAPAPAHRLPAGSVPDPVVSERRPARRSGVASWAVGVASVGTVAIVVALRFGAAAPPEPEPSAREAPPATEAAPSPPPPAAAPASHPEPREVQPARTVIERAPPAPITTAPPTAVPKPAPPVPAEDGDFDRAAAGTALAKAAAAAAGCKQADDPAGGARVSITFAPSGHVTSARVTGQPFQGTRIGACIAATFHTVIVPPFSGDPVVITKDVNVR
jgi:hypothetical protein